MFGNNPIRHADNNPRQLAVESTFYTIQGEGPYSGKAALFIRLAGCNLACWFCDTQFETNADKPQSTSAYVDHLCSMYTEDQRRFVVLTGGEPLRQNISELLGLLYATGTQLVQIETAGTLWGNTGIQIEHHFRAGRLDIVCSPKTVKVHPWIGLNCRHWKYIISDGGVSDVDGLPIFGTSLATSNQRMTIYRPEAAHPASCTIWVSPCDEYDEEKNRRNVELCRSLVLKFQYRLSLQVHKLIGVE